MLEWMLRITTIGVGIEPSAFFNLIEGGSVLSNSIA